MNEAQYTIYEKATIPVQKFPQDGIMKIGLRAYTTSKLEAPVAHFEWSITWSSDPVERAHQSFLKKFYFEQFKDHWLKHLFEELVSLGQHRSENDPPLLKYFGKISMDLTIHKKRQILSPNNIFITGPIKSAFTCLCARCNTPQVQKINLDLNAISLPANLQEDSYFKDMVDIELLDQEFEVYFHENTGLQLGKLIREQLIVNFDYHFVHSENCQGLCTICGANLNLTPCLHHPLGAYQ